MAQLFIFGDSITYGMWGENGGWPARIRQAINANHLDNVAILNTDNYFTVYQLGIPDETTAGLLNRLEGEIKARLNPDQKNLFLFAIGINDTQLLKEKNDQSEISLVQFRENIEKIIHKAQSFSEQIAFVGLTRVDEMRTNPLFWQPNVRYLNKVVEKYDTELEAICKEQNLRYISLRSIDFADKLKDGIHPTTEGHEHIFETVMDFLTTSWLG